MIYFSGTIYKEGKHNRSSVFGTSKNVWRASIFKSWKVRLLDFLGSVVVGCEAVFVTWTHFVHFLVSFSIFSLVALKRSTQKTSCNCHICFYFHFYFCMSVTFVQQCHNKLIVPWKCSHIFFVVFVLLPFFNCFTAWDVVALDRQFLSKWHIPLHNPTEAKLNH